MKEIKDELKKMLTDKPKTRESLCAALGCTDSELRGAVRKLRESGVPVCSSNKTRGYWFGDKADTMRTAKELRAKAFTLLREASKLDGKEIDGQIKIGEDIPNDLFLNETDDGQLTINF